MPATAREKLLGQGIYDVVEVGRLIRRDPSTIARWTSKRAKDRPFLEPSLGPGLYNFHDLVSLYVISELLGRSVKKRFIVAGGEYIANKLDTERPYAHERLATVGAAFFADVDDEWLDVGRYGQMAFPDIVAPLLKPIAFGNDGMAVIWRPAPGVSLDPQIQTGAACIEGTRVPTALIAGFIVQGDESQQMREEIDDVADDYHLTSDQVRNALHFERHHFNKAA